MSTIFKNSILFLILGYSTLVNCQSKGLTINVISEATQKPIQDAHVFIANSTIGGFTNTNGIIKLNVPEESTNEIIISHLSYQALSISSEEYLSSNGELIVSLTQSNIDLSNIVISAKRDKQWKRNFNRFKKAFIGEGKIASKCEILNPEVLRFEELESGFKVSAVDLIQIKNEHLQYKLYFLLNTFEIDKNGSTRYQGRSFFEELQESKSKKVIDQRQAVFEKGLRYYLKSIIDGTSQDLGFKSSIQKYTDNQFIELSQINPSEYLIFDEQNQIYNLYFSEFLQVINLNQKSSILETKANLVSGLERSRFGNPTDGKRSKIEYATSQLYKTSPTLILDKYGHLLNPNTIKEYGYWANLKVAHLLPWDYKLEWQTQPNLLNRFKKLIYGSPNEKEQTLDFINTTWKSEYTAPLVELLRMSSDKFIVKEISEILKTKTQEKENDFYDAIKNLWEKEKSYNTYYPDFKAEIYKHIDDRFETYFMGRANQSLIRFDEILWGGVRQDGIPPLRYPKMISAQEASYLNDDNIVFGISINGITRAYPKRILAWHEFFVDDFNGTKIAGVYCTLCGTVIPYDMTFNGVIHNLGTSGFLYRSNKLMYDQATQSLWSTIDGSPVVGPLINQGIKLESHAVVTTTWKEWKTQHPNTEVLSLDTGHERNYDEGEAYKTYYSNDKLMFPVPNSDKKLKNKDEVFVIRIPENEFNPIVFDVKYLKKKKLIHHTVGEIPIVIITNESGAARAYHSDNLKFKWNEKNLKDQNDQEWIINEYSLINHEGKQLRRLPAHNIFWFAWINYRPNTILIK